MAHEYKDQIICPYCDYKLRNSSELAEDGSGSMECSRCGKEFDYEVNISVDYSTFKKNCKQIGIEHDYKFESYFLKNLFLSTGVWVDLPENEWKYKRIEKCSICEDKRYIEITKAEYEAGIINKT